jgi:DNA mismatch repair protein MutL
MSLNLDAPGRDKIYTQPKVSYNTGYNPFNTAASGNGETDLQKVNKQHWESMFEGFKNDPQTISAAPEAEQQAVESLKKEAVDFTVFQLNLKYLVTTYNNHQVMIVDQQRAHERIVYEHYLTAKKENPIATQQLLFPEQVEMSANDFTLVKSLLEEFKALGFDLEIFGKNSIVINGAPADMGEFNVQQTIEGILETYKLNTIDTKVEKHDNLCRAIAKNTSIKYGKKLETEEMKLLLNHLMRCDNPLYSANGKIVMMEVEYGDIEKFFRK